MREDSEGFFYPEVDTDACVDCGLCERVCPLANPGNPKHWMEVIGAKNRNEDELLGSSSGGVFINLARNVIAEGGIVFGAVFDGSWNVVHTYADSIDGVRSMMGSKYVQSDINDSYIKAERFLEDGRIVLFTGTPCQVAGLNRYLRKATRIFYRLIFFVMEYRGRVCGTCIWTRYAVVQAVRPDRAKIRTVW